MSALIARQNEPTMDEILASIRKIISDDLGDVAAQPVADYPASAASSADILELSSQMALPAAREPSWGPSIAKRGEPAYAPAPAPIDPVSAVTELAARMARSSAPVEAPKETAMAVETTQAVSSSFGALRETIQRASVADNALALAKQTVIDAALTPLLKEWIDAHLPAMVERLIKAEIERMVQRG